MTTNIQAEAFADQVRAAIRDGEPIPDGPIVAAAARTIRAEDAPAAMREPLRKLLDSWARMEGVDRPEEGISE